MTEKDSCNILPAFSENNFPIVFASDNNYVRYLSVTILSLIENCSNKYNYDIVVLENNIAEKNKKLLFKQISEYKNVSLRFVDVQKFFDENKGINFSTPMYFNLAIYNRLFIPEIFKNYDKVLYLDCDIVVKGDLYELYDMDIKEYYIAAAIDMGCRAWEEKNNNLDDFYRDKVINSGIILYNIKKCIDINFTEKCLENIQKHNFLDQETIDMTCKGKIKYIDYRYNFFVSFLDDYEDLKKSMPESILNDIRIIHFTGAKCWFKDFSHESNIDWYQYFMKTPFFNKLLLLIIMKFELFRYKTCLITTKSSKHSKYRKKIYVLSKILNNMKN